MSYRNWTLEAIRIDYKNKDIEYVDAVLAVQELGHSAKYAEAMVSEWDENYPED